MSFESSFFPEILKQPLPSFLNVQHPSGLSVTTWQWWCHHLYGSLSHIQILLHFTSGLASDFSILLVMLIERLLIPLQGDFYKLFTNTIAFLSQCHVSETPGDVLLWKSCFTGDEIDVCLNSLSSSLKNDLSSLICYLSMPHSGFWSTLHCNI